MTRASSATRFATRSTGGSPPNEVVQAISAGVRYWQATAIWFVSGIHLLLHLSNVVGFPIDPSFGRYYLASILIVSFGALQLFMVALGLLKPAA